MNDITEPGRQIIEAPVNREKWTTERVLSIRYWTPTLLSFRTTRYSGFRFTAGQYARLGLGSNDEEAVWRPYSLVSASYDDYLEFIAVQVPGGAFSALLAQLKIGDEIRVDKCCFGFLTVDQLASGNDLWLLASGTGLGPFMSILREPAIWREFERLIVVHSVRQAAELAYREEIGALPADALFADSKAQLIYIPVVTRDPGATTLSARIPQLFSNGKLEEAAQRALSRETSRVMVCGNPELAREMRQILSAQGFSSNRRGILGQMAFEKYW